MAINGLIGSRLFLIQLVSRSTLAYCDQYKEGMVWKHLSLLPSSYLQSQLLTHYLKTGRTFCSFKFSFPKRLLQAPAYWFEPTIFIHGVLATPFLWLARLLRCKFMKNFFLLKRFFHFKDFFQVFTHF